MLVVDASVLVTVLAGAEHADWAEAQISAGGAHRSLWAPHLIDAEVGHSLRRLVASGDLRDDRATTALSDLPALPLRRIVHTNLLERAWQLRHNLSFYDGIYVALAELLDVPLITLDRRLARAAGNVSGATVLTVA
jgi:predicted nucleic acid-binding protein